MRRAWWFALTVLALAGAIGFFVWRPAGGNAADAPYRLGSVDRGPITASVRATGTLNPVTTVLVGSQLSGLIVEILADYNSPVKAGQVVARLDQQQVRARRDAAAADVEQARAEAAMRRAQIDRTRATSLRAEANLRDLMAQKDKVSAQLAEARRGLDRQTELTARNIASQTALDAARTQTEVQKATLASTEAQIASQQAELVGLKADLANAEAQAQSAEAMILQRQAKLRDTEIDLGRTEIRSPVDGVVVQRQVDLGQTVAASLNAPTLFTIAQDLRAIDIYANIDEADVGRVKPGQAVTFTVNAYPNRTFSGSVRLVRLGAQTVQNVVTYTAVIGVENGDLALMPGMTANLQIVTDERGDSLRVPNAALRFRPAGQSAAAPPMPDSSTAPQPPSSVQRGARAIETLRERVATEVRPTPEQAAEIDRIIAESRQSFPGREPGIADEDRRAAMRQFRREMQTKIAAALDPERRTKFEAIAAEGRRGPAAPGAQADSAVPGRVFVPDAEGKPRAVALRLGVTDGSFTEVLGGDLKEGAAVIVGGGPRPPAPAPNAESAPGSRPQRGPRLF